MTKRSDKNRSSTDGGFSVIELLIVMAIVLTVTGLALLSTGQARNKLQLSNNVEVLKGYIERAFTDAHKRHASGGERSIIAVSDPTHFNVTIDFDGDGVLESRSITLTDGVRFDYDPAATPTATVDWRGSVAEGSVTFRLRNIRNETVELHLSDSGDAGIDNSGTVMPAITVTPISTDVSSRVVVNGNSTPVANPSPTPTPTPLPYCTGTQLPGTNNCRCTAGKTIDSTGKCH